jgi:hypothetical protein
MRINRLRRPLGTVELRTGGGVVKTCGSLIAGPGRYGARSRLALRNGRGQLKAFLANALVRALVVSQGSGANKHRKTWLRNFHGNSLKNEDPQYSSGR